MARPRKNIDELVDMIVSPDDAVTFKCNLPEARIKRVAFSAGYYTTDKPDEIKMLREYGCQQGVCVTEVKRGE